MRARVDLAEGVVVVSSGSRGCTITLPKNPFTVRDRADLTNLITGLMEVREELLEAPARTFKNEGTGDA